MRSIWNTTSVAMILRRTIAVIIGAVLPARKARAFAQCQSLGYGCDGCGSGGFGVCVKPFPWCTFNGKDSCYELWVCDDGTTYTTNESEPCCWSCL